MITSTTTRAPAAGEVSGAGTTLAGTGMLLRFMLRRDRIRLPGWTLGLTLLMAYFTTALQTVMQTPDDLAGLSGFAKSPVGALFGGPGYGYDHLTLERFLAGQYGLYLLLGAGLMSLLTVTRHTRAEERSGRAELVRANVVGRHAQLTAALALTTLMNLVVAVLIAGVLAGSGFDGGGAALFGAGLGAFGLTVAGIAAVTVQLSEYPRGAAGMAGAALGAMFVLRGLGDMAAVQGSGLAWLSWLSPLGWSQQTAPYVLDRWWPLLLSVAFAATTAVVGYALSARRDIGAGLVPPRLGAGSAPAWLRSPVALAFRLQRAGLIGWSVALLVGGAAYGSFTQPMLDGFADAPEDLVAVMGGAEDTLSGFLGLLALTMAFTVTVFAVLAVQSMRSEETDGRAEPVLATAVSRPGWLGAQLAVTALGVLWLLLVAGLGIGIGAAVSTGDAGLVGDLVAGHLAHTPAVWLVLAIAALLYAAVPRAVPAAWLIVGYAVVVGFFAPILDVSEQAIRISPFEHVGRYPLGEISTAALLTLAGLALVVSATALSAFRRRDLNGTT